MAHHVTHLSPTGTYNSYMSIRKSIFAIALVLVSVFAGAADCKGLKKASCDPARKAAAAAQAPSPECTLPPFVPAPSFTTPGVIIGDGVREVGIDMPAGTWLSTNIPADTPKCVWFVTPNPSKDPATQNLPSYTEFKKQHHQIRVVLEPGMGFTTAGCGTWELTSPMTAPEPSDVR